MEFKEFSEVLRDTIQEKMGDGYICTLDNLEKLNDKSRPVLWIKDKNTDNQAIPSIYLDELYECYKDGSFTLAACVEFGIKLYRKFRDKDHAAQMRDIISKWEMAKKQVFPVLVSRIQSEQFMKKVIHTSYLDILIVYEVWVKISDTDKISCVKVTSSLLNDWGITKEELHKTAMDNLKQSSHSLIELKEALVTMLAGGTAEQSVSMEKGKLYELSVINRVRGAGMILDTELLSRLANGQNLLILLITIHDATILVDDGKIDREDLKNYVNSTYEIAEDGDIQLSGSVYYFDAGKKEVCVLN